MKNKCIILALLLASTYSSVCAQSNYKIGVNGSSRWTRPIHFDDQYAFWRHGGGLSVIKPLRNRLSIESGLTYLRASSQFSDIPDLRFVYDADGEVNGIETVGTMSIVEKYNYLSLPLLAHYAIVENKKTNVTLVGGVLFDWLINRKNLYDRTFDGKQTVVFATGLSTEKINTVIRVGFGVERNINERFSIMLAPSINQELMSAIEARDNFTSLALSLHVFYLYDRY